MGFLALHCLHDKVHKLYAQCGVAKKQIQHCKKNFLGVFTKFLFRFRNSTKY